MGRLENEFAWSASRSKLLDECARAYFWSYYGSWEGWEKKAKWVKDETRLAYRLKKLDSRWSWAGGIVHMVVRRVVGDIRAGRAYDAEALILGARETMRAELKSSRSGKRDAKNARGWWGLLEHEYQEPIENEEWRKIWERVERSLRNFFASPIPKMLAGIPTEMWIELDSSNSGGKPAGFKFDGVKVYAIPDLVVSAPDGPVIVFDWKTGKPRDNDEEQVLGYALYLAERYGVDPTSVEARAVYLLDDARSVTFATTHDALTSYSRRLSDDINRGRMLVAGQDVRANKPLPMSEFHQTDNLRDCARCPFRRLCAR